MLRFYKLQRLEVFMPLSHYKYRRHENFRKFLKYIIKEANNCFPCPWLTKETDSILPAVMK